MKLATVILLAMTITASAQNSLPTTKNLVDKSGQKIGTATTWAGVTVFRDINGAILGSASISDRNTLTFRDPDGKITNSIETRDNVITLHNGSGEIVSTTTKDKNGAVTVTPPKP